MKFYYLDSEERIYTSNSYLTLEERYDEAVDTYDEYLGQYSISLDEANKVCMQLVWDQIEEYQEFETYDEFVYELVSTLNYEQTNIEKRRLGLMK